MIDLEQIKALNGSLESKIAVDFNGYYKIDVIQANTEWFKMHFKKEDSTFLFFKSVCMKKQIESFDCEDDEIISKRIQDSLNRQSKDIKFSVTVDTDIDKYDIGKQLTPVYDRIFQEWKDIAYNEVLAGSLVIDSIEQLRKVRSTSLDSLDPYDYVKIGDSYYYFTGKANHSNNSQIWAKAIDPILSFGIQLNIGDKKTNKKTIFPSQVKDYDNPYCALSFDFKPEIIAEAKAIEAEENLLHS